MKGCEVGLLAAFDDGMSAGDGADEIYDCMNEHEWQSMVGAEGYRRHIGVSREGIRRHAATFLGQDSGEVVLRL